MRPKEDWIAAGMVAAALLWATGARADEIPPAYAGQVANALFRVENSPRYPYGIKSIDTGGNADYARRICLNTIKNNWRRWRAAGSPGQYLDFLADKYCPIAADPVGNVRWKKNIKIILKQRLTA